MLTLFQALSVPSSCTAGSIAASNKGLGQMVTAIYLLLLLFPSVGLTLVDAPSPWLRDLCASGGMPAASCEDLLGSAQEFTLCEQTDDTCSFSVRLDGSNCHELCRSFGSTCVAALDNQGSTCTVIPDNMDTCQTRRNTEICVCERRNDVVSERVACATAFGDAPGFRLCSESEDQCAFNANTDGDNCHVMCSRFNARCLGAQDNEGSSCVANPNDMDDCNTNRSTEICICERPFQP